MPDFRIAVAVISLLGLSISASAQQHGSKYHNAKEALDAAKSSGSEQAELAALDELSGVQDLNRDDILALHDSMRSLEARAKGKGDEYARARLKRMAKALERCTREKDKATIAELLDKEADDLPRNLSTPFDDKASEAEGVRMSRVAMLIQLSGKAGNQAALPALRRISKKGGVPAELAQQAIGQIGAPEDLDAFVDEIKKNPKSRVNFAGFGPGIVDRIMREVDDPKLDDTARAALIARIGQASGPGVADKLKPLTHHKDKRVAEAASFALGKSVPAGDSSAALEMLKDSNREVRFNALLAIESKAWSDDKVPALIEILRKDPDEGVRAQAAKILGRKRALSAEPALKEALNDQSSRVRSAAESALKWLSGEYQNKIKSQVEGVRRNR